MSRIEVPYELEHVHINMLKLSDRTQTVLARSGIVTIKDLLDFRSRGYRKKAKGRGINLKTISEIEETLSILYKLDSDFPAETNALFKDEVPFLININLATGINLLELLLPFIRGLMEVKGMQRAYDILRRRYGIEGSKVYTLEEIGEYYGLTRERIRQIRSSSERMIAETLLGRKKVKGRRVQKEIVEEASVFYSILYDLGDVFLDVTVKEILGDRYKATVVDDATLKLMLSLFGFESLSRNQTGVWDDPVTIWAHPASSLRHNLRDVVDSLQKLLEQCGGPLEYFEIKVRLNRNRNLKLTDTQIRSVLQVCPEIEALSDDFYQTRFEYLSSLADKSYRILKKQGHPLHIREITREINHRLTSVQRKPDVRIASFHGQLINDQRFEPVGRSGKWSLAEWKHIRRDIIVDLMQEFFHRVQGKASVNDVHEFVETNRPGVPKNSIRTLLKLYPDTFVQVTKGEYELTAWGAKPYQFPQPKYSRGEIQGQIFRVIDALFEGQIGSAIPLAKFIRDISVKTGKPKQSIRNRLPTLKMIEVVPNREGHGRNKVVRYLGIQSPREELVAKEDSLEKTITVAITQYLEEQKDYRARVSDVAVHVMGIIGCKRPTFYKQLSEMQNIEKEKIGSKMYCFLKMNQIPQAREYPNISLIKDTQLREEINTAIGNMNLQNIDAGLFQIGKIFENELRLFLEEVRLRKAFPVVRNDLDKLANMIDCVVRNGVIKKGYHLTLLREKRNERAHDRMPTLEERKKLMLHAPFLVDMYLDYILFFHKEREVL